MMNHDRATNTLALLLAVLLLACGGLLVTLQYAQAATPSPAPAYTVTAQNGHLAVVDSQGGTTVLEEVYTYLLPEDDIEALRHGIPVENDAQLRAVLEDLGW